MHGSVKVTLKADSSQTVILKPDHKLSLEKGRFVMTKVEDYNPYRWKEGLICFSDESFPNIMKDFEKYYGVKIVTLTLPCINVVSNFSVSGYASTLNFVPNTSML